MDGKKDSEKRQRFYYHSCYLGQELYEKVCLLAKHWKLPKSYVVRRCLDLYIDRVEQDLKREREGEK